MKVTLNSFSRISTSVMLAGSLAFAVGCSDSSDSKDPAPAVGANVTDTTSTGQTGNSATGTAVVNSDSPGATVTPGKIDCEAAWKAYVATNPVGLTLGYKVTSETKNADGEILNSTVVDSETKVLVSNDALVTTQTAISLPGLPINPTATTLTKVKFIEGCSTVGTIDLGDTTATVLEQAAQKITVPAGTFDTNYTKISIANEELQDTIVMTWVMADGSNIQVKSQTSATIPGLGFTNTSTTELVKIVRP